MRGAFSRYLREGSQFLDFVRHIRPRHKWNLLPRSALVRTSGVDHADWNFEPFLGVISRIRFHLVSYLIGDRSVGSLLELGYGSGVLLPELKKYAEALHGVDVHDFADDVAQSLEKHGTKATLFRASASELPFGNCVFDAIVTLSTLEFVSDLDGACREMSRVLKPNGSVIVIVPGHSPVVDFGLRLLTGSDPGKDFGQRRQKVIPALQEHFHVEAEICVPPIFGFSLYRGLRLRPKVLTRRYAIPLCPCYRQVS